MSKARGIPSGSWTWDYCSIFSNTLDPLTWNIYCSKNLRALLTPVGIAFCELALWKSWLLTVHEWNIIFVLQIWDLLLNIRDQNHLVGYLRLSITTTYKKPSLWQFFGFSWRTESSWRTISQYHVQHSLKHRPGGRGLIPEMIQVCDYDILIVLIELNTLI